MVKQVITVHTCLTGLAMSAGGNTGRKSLLLSHQCQSGFQLSVLCSPVEIIIALPASAPASAIAWTSTSASATA